MTAQIYVDGVRVGYVVRSGRDAYAYLADGTPVGCCADLDAAAAILKARAGK